MDFFQEFKLNAIIDIIDFLKPTIIYESLGSVAMVYISFGIPIFLTFALFSRYLEESAKAMAGEAKFIVAIKDTLVTWGMATIRALYCTTLSLTLRFF